ncbi:MAG TPA: YggT family protein [Nitrospirota bacterium]|jgi:YggT family protein
MAGLLAGNFIGAVASVLDFLLEAYKWIIIIAALISWVNPDPYNPIVRFLYAATEPVLRPIRRKLPATGIDFSPLIVIAVIIFIQLFLIKTLRQMALGIG